MGQLSSRTKNTITALRKIILFTTLSLFSLICFSQRGGGSYSMMNSKKYSDVFPDFYHIKRTGWLFAFGITEMKPQTFSFVKSFFSDTTYTPASRTGLYLEVGRYKLFEYYSVFRYMDYGLCYKGLRGKERQNDLKFGDHFISGYFNLNNTVNIGKYAYWGNTLGINADYAIIRNIDQPTIPKAFQTAIHYKISFGYKATKRLVIIPAVETPILTLYPFYYGASSMKYLNSRYRPLIFSIKFLFLRPIVDVCPPVYTPNKLEDYSNPSDMGQ